MIDSRMVLQANGEGNLYPIQYLNRQ